MNLPTFPHIYGKQKELWQDPLTEKRRHQSQQIWHWVGDGIKRRSWGGVMLQSGLQIFNNSIAYTMRFTKLSYQLMWAGVEISWVWFWFYFLWLPNKRRSLGLKGLWLLIGMFWLGSLYSRFCRPWSFSVPPHSLASLIFITVTCSQTIRLYLMYFFAL